ncbi:MAG: transposase, partial [Actinobacteria bacterium]|nr:transposase [Actinomycetota bacterium]
MLCDLVAGGVPDEIYAEEADLLLADVEPASAEAAACLELAHELLDDPRRVDHQIAESKNRLEHVVAASGTTVIEIFGVGPDVAATVVGVTGDIARFPICDRFAAFNGTAPIEVCSAVARPTGSPAAGTHPQPRLSRGRHHPDPVPPQPRRRLLRPQLLRRARRPGGRLEHRLRSLETSWRLLARTSGTPARRQRSGPASVRCSPKRAAWPPAPAEIFFVPRDPHRVPQEGPLAGGLPPGSTFRGAGGRRATALEASSRCGGTSTWPSCPGSLWRSPRPELTSTSRGGPLVPIRVRNHPGSLRRGARRRPATLSERGSPLVRNRQTTTRWRRRQATPTGVRRRHPTTDEEDPVFPSLAAFLATTLGKTIAAVTLIAAAATGGLAATGNSAAVHSDPPALVTTTDEDECDDLEDEAAEKACDAEFEA